MKKLFLILFLVTTSLICCRKDRDEWLLKHSPSTASSLKISAGFMCGWGSGEDSLIITKSEIRYVYTVPSRSSVPEINKTRPTTTEEWDRIVNSVNFSVFSGLDYNSCNICVDGCDEWISIMNGSSTHKITFGLGLNIDSISELQSVISQLRSEFRK
jgi:hypothetical protein